MNTLEKDIRDNLIRIEKIDYLIDSFEDSCFIDSQLYIKTLERIKIDLLSDICDDLTINLNINNLDFKIIDKEE